VPAHERATDLPGGTHEVPAPREPAPAAASTPTQQVLALQRSVGNRQVAALLGGGMRPPVLARGKKGATADPEPAGPVTKDPEVESWGVRIKPGGQGKGLERTMDAATTKVFVGDTAYLHVKFKKLKVADHPYVGAVLVAGGDIDAGLPDWPDARTMRWELKFKKVGMKSARMTLSAGATQHEHAELFRVVADLHDFTLACVEAQSTLLGKFAGATRKINEAASAFRKAYATQKTDLEDVANTEKMINDLIFGALFAGAGGFAGGFVGGWLKNVRDKALKEKDYIIDAAKDTVKFAVRSADKLRGGGTPLSSGDSTAPSVTDIGRARGERQASGKDPLDFLTDLSAQVAGEGEEAQASLTSLIKGAREARSADSKADFEEDPVTVVTRDLTLDSIVAELNTEPKLWLKALWKAWLGAYAYKAMGPNVRENVKDKIREKIEKAAADCGESADAWIAEFGLPAKERAQKEAAEWEPPEPDYSNVAWGGA
jgi:hypothetical protein